MFTEIKRLTQHSLVYGLGNFIERFLSFLLLPLYMYLLNPTEYGINVLIFQTIAFLNIFYAYGLDAAFLRYYILTKSTEERSSFFSTAVSALLLTTALVTAAIFLSADRIVLLFAEGKASPVLIKMASLILLFDVFSLFGFLVLRAEEKPRQFAGLKIFKASLILILNVVFVAGMKMGVHGILLANVIGSNAALLSVLFVYFRVFRFAFNKSRYVELVKFGLPYIFIYLAFDIMEFIDRYFLEYYLGTGTVGIYGASYKVSMIMKLIVSAFALAWHPFFLSLQGRENCREIYARILTYFSLICFGVFLFTCLFVDDILKVVPFLGVEYAQDYKKGLIILPYILAAYYFFGVYVNMNVGIYIEKKSYYLPFTVGISAVVNIAGNWILIPRYGLVGAAESTTLSYAVLAGLLYLVSLRIYPIAYEWGRLAKMAAATALVFTVPAYAGEEHRFIVELAAFFSFPVLLWLFRVFTPLEKVRVKSLIADLFVRRSAP